MSRLYCGLSFSKRITVCCSEGLLKVDVDDRMSLMENNSQDDGDEVCYDGNFYFPKIRPERAELIMKILNKNKRAKNKYFATRQINGHNSQTITCNYNLLNTGQNTNYLTCQ